MKFTKDRVGPKEIFKWPVVGLLGLLNPPTVHWWIWRQKMRKCYSKFMVTTLANRAKSTRKILKYEIKYKIIMAIYIDKSTKNTRPKLDPAFFASAKIQTVLPKVLLYQSLSEGRSHKPVDRKVEGGIHQL